MSLGTEAGKPVKNFKRMWRELFKLAGLDYGRKNGLTWHTIRHEFVSRDIENTGLRLEQRRLCADATRKTRRAYCGRRKIAARP
jgi:hypothetical protein